MIGHFGLYFDMSFAVAPVVVAATMALALRTLDVLQAE